ncbi:MAG: PadR family transcriptional regulator [Candidatus Bathyarchaeia archaeon]|jgi:DNA-binding PadR family transcriptional regulator
MTFEEQEKTTGNWVKEAQKGYIRVASLIILNKRPAHGYEIMKEIRDKTRGFWKPTAGGMYPILRDLEKAGYIVGDWSTVKNRKIKVYRITETGEAILRSAMVKQSELASGMNSLFQEFARDVLNVEPKKASMPMMPSPFDAFLNENRPESKEDLESLKQKQKHFKEVMAMVQKELAATEKEIAKLKTH